MRCICNFKIKPYMIVVLGKPANLMDRSNPDWIPSINLGGSIEAPVDRKAPPIVEFECHEMVDYAYASGYNVIGEKISFNDTGATTGKRT